MTAYDNKNLMHLVGSLGEIYDVHEFNQATHRTVTPEWYDATIKYLGIENKEETQAKFKRMSENTYKNLVEAKHTYCINKARFGDNT